jgi:hypothetical protein
MNKYIKKINSNVLYMKYTVDQLVLATATAVGAYGGFPAAPAAFTELTKNEMVQWALVYVLIYQGGGAQDPKLTLLMTAAMFAAHQAMM